MQNWSRFSQQERGQWRKGNTRNENVTNGEGHNWENDNHQEGEENDEYQGDLGEPLGVYVEGSGDESPSDLDFGGTLETAVLTVRWAVSSKQRGSSWL